MLTRRRLVGDGFAWWLPLLTAGWAALIAALIVQSSATAWDADVHLWAREGEVADYVEVLLDPDLQRESSSEMMMGRDGLAELQGVSVESTGTLIRLTVRASDGVSAESLAISLARAAVLETDVTLGGQAGLDVLGLVQPGARKQAPQAERAAAASVVGLLGGIALAWLLANRVTGRPSTLGRMGRVGIRPLAVVPKQAAATATPPDALVDALEPIDGVVATITHVATHDAEDGAERALSAAARTLAARGRRVLWLDARRPGFEHVLTSPPRWLFGAVWRAVPRSELIRRSAREAAGRSDTVFLLTDPVSDSLAGRDTVQIAQSAKAVVLLLSASSGDDTLMAVRQQLRGAVILGAVVVDADDADLVEFEQAQAAE